MSGWRKWKRQDGASAVEFAIVLPVLVLFLFGIIEFGIYLYNKQVVTNASREGARAGIVAQDPRWTSAEITDLVTRYSQNNLIFYDATRPPPTVEAVGCRPDPDWQRGDDLTVRVTYSYTYLFLPFMPATITAATTMRYE